MSYINWELCKKIPDHLKGAMEYYPDVFLLKLNQTQYTHLWQQLCTSKYLYTDGYEIKPATWYMYAFQSFKEWLGFDNKCHPEKIAYSLSKLAYYGYMNQFNQPAFSLMPGYSMPPEICGLSSKNCNDLNTAKLQAELIKAYFKIEPHLNLEYSFQRLNSIHRFGESWFCAGAIELIPQLDPQDDSLIASVIAALDKSKASYPTLVFLKNSKYAKAAAHYYYEKAINTPVPSFITRLMWTDPRPGYLSQALIYYPEIARQYAQIFIEYHLERKEYAYAFNLLEQLNDSAVILKFLLAIPEIGRAPIMQKDSPPAAILAKYYLDKKQYGKAQQLYTNIELLNSDAAFCIAVKEHNYIKAYELFKKSPDPNIFSIFERQALAREFNNAAENEYKAGKPYRVNKQWETAKKHYLQSLIQKKTAFHINPTNEYLEEVYTHKRLYAQLLLDADIDQNKPEDSDICAIQNVIWVLKECSPTKIEELQRLRTVLSNGLMRRIDCLREKIAFTYTPRDNLEIQNHKEKFQTEISMLIKTLNELILILRGFQNKNSRIKRGKAHFLLADVQDFFQINAADINQHYKMAMEAVPDNPFYILRVSEIFTEEKIKYQNKGIIKLKNLGYKVMDYLHWFDERWVKKDHIIYDVKDIHQTFIESQQQINPSEWALVF